MTTVPPAEKKNSRIDGLAVVPYHHHRRSSLFIDLEAATATLTRFLYLPLSLFSPPCCDPVSLCLFNFKSHINYAGDISMTQRQCNKLLQIPISLTQ